MKTNLLLMWLRNKENETYKLYCL